MGLVSRLPWHTKLLTKLALARLPVPYRFWRSIGLFRHGEMNDPARAINTFRTYFDRARQHIPLEAGFSMLELGPGDSILSGLVAKAYGAGQSWLVDAGRFATTDLAGCQQTAALLRSQGARPPAIEDATSLAEVLDRAQITYLTEGTASLSRIPDASVDLIWSQVVLEHVPKAEFPQLMREFRRILKPGGISVHSIDFRDHLDGGLNNLRFPAWLWESHYFRNSGFYTNRLRPREMITMFEEAGFSVEVLSRTHWPHMPIARSALGREFRHMPEDDFMVCEIEVILRPRSGEGA